MSTFELENRAMLQPSVRELWCGGCGYRVVIRRDPPECPICRQTSWRERPPVAQYN